MHFRILLIAGSTTIVTVCLGAIKLMGKNVLNYQGFTRTCQVKNAASSEPLQQVAESITVRIFSKNGGASGTIIAKQGQVYTVLTSEQVLTSGAPYRIQTPDGYIYPAIAVKKFNFEGNNLALLQFFGFGDRYAVASLATSSTPGINDKVFAAGYPSDAKEVIFTSGKISLLPNKTFRGGYRIGYTNEIQQGMSGGPLLNYRGEVIGINGIHAYPLFGNPFVFEDGSQPNHSERQQMMGLNWGVPIQKVVQSIPQLVANNPVNQVERIAQAITLTITYPNGIGSGVIIGRHGKTYYALTANHVVRDNTEYEVIAPDGRCYPVGYQAIERLTGVDLAVLQFESDRAYQVATLGQYDLSQAINPIFVSGWAAAKQGSHQQPSYLFTAGLLFDQELAPLLTNNSGSFSNGYELVYTNITAAGVSGGPLLDLGGRVIGIHGRADGEFTIDAVGQPRRIQVGYSLGVPIHTFLSLAPQLEMKPALQVETTAPPLLSLKEKDEIGEYLLPKKAVPLDATDAIDWLNYGNQLWRLFRLEEALQAFDKAIQLKPNFYQAWYVKGLTLKLQKNYPAAIESFNRAIASFDKSTQKEETLALAWRERGNALFSLQHYQAALESYDRAIELSPEEFALHQWRADTLRELKQYAEAIAAYSEAIRLKPDYAEAYLNRGVTRGILGDYAAAIADYSEAIRLKPNYALAYNNRGLAYFYLKNYQQAIADYTEAIRLKPELAQSYTNRALAFNLVGDKLGELADYQRAAQLFQEQGNQAQYQKVQDSLRQLQ